jgi:hypothetical protein
VGDPEAGVLPQRSRHVLGRADQPGRSRALAAELAGSGVEVVIEDIALGGQRRQSPLAGGGLPVRVARELSVPETTLTRTRPPLRWSSVAAALAKFAGCQ